MVPEIEKACLLFYPRKIYRGSLYRLGKDHRKSQMLYRPKVLQHPQRKNAYYQSTGGISNLLHHTAHYERRKI